MRTAKTAAAGVIAFVAIACTDSSSVLPTAPTRTPNGPQLITGGQPTGSSYAGVGALLIDQDGDQIADFLCTGSLISPTVFLTAGHCILGVGAAYYVSFSPDLIGQPMGFIPSATAYASADDDLGVIILPGGSTTGVPVYDLPEPGLLNALNVQGGLKHDRAILVGYGSANLRGQEVSGLDLVRKTAMSRILQLLGRQIVIAGASGRSGRGGICYGDSGGPMFLANEDPNLIVGVASVVLPAGCQALGAYTRLDTPTALVFLGQYLTS